MSSEIDTAVTIPIIAAERRWYPAPIPTLGEPAPDSLSTSSTPRRRRRIHHSCCYL